MQLLIIALALAFIAAVIIVVIQWNKAAAINQLLEATAPLLIRLGFPFGLVAQVGPFVRWKEVARGGNTKPGVHAGHGNCPCEKQYTVATIQINFPARPNAAQIAAATINPPAPDKVGVVCKGECIPVMTHVWHGWVLLLDTLTGRFLLNNETFAQYHCKLPNDPDAQKPPKEGDPGGDVEL